MKRIKIVVFLLCLLLLATTLSACDPDISRMEADAALACQFMEYVMANDYDSAYAMVKETVTDEDFRTYWTDIQAVTEGATTYEITLADWDTDTVNGVTDSTVSERVTLDNGRIVLLRVMTRDGIEGIAGIHFSDVTDFLQKAEPVVPKISIALQILHFVFLGFTLWMFVDCLRRKLRYKLVWLILIVMSLVLTITVGEASDLAFRVSFWFARGTVSTIDIELGQVAVVTKLVIPVGALLYLCLRKHFVVEKPAPENQTPETEQV